MYASFPVQKKHLEELAFYHRPHHDGKQIGLLLVTFVIWASIVIAFFMVYFEMITQSLSTLEALTANATSMLISHFCQVTK